LGVAHILQGSVRNQGDQLRITTTLVQTSDGVQEWSNTYDGKLADVFNLQESCARDIAAHLDVVLGENGQQRLVDKTTDNAEAYAALSYVAFSRRRYVEMVAPAARAVALDPEDFTANYWTANELTATGRFTEAEAMIDQIVNRDPANALALYYKCLLRWLAGDKPAASRMAQRAEALGLPLGGFTLAFISGMQGEYDRGAPQYARAMLALGTKFTSAELETIYRGA